VVLFVFNGAFPGCDLRHYTFMLQGLQEVQVKLDKRRILFIARKGDPPEEVVRCLKRPPCWLWIEGTSESKRNGVKRWPNGSRSRCAGGIRCGRAGANRILQGRICRATISAQDQKTSVQFSRAVGRDSGERGPGNISLRGLDFRGSLSKILSSFPIDPSATCGECFRGGPRRRGNG